MSVPASFYMILLGCRAHSVSGAADEDPGPPAPTDDTGPPVDPLEPDGGDGGADSDVDTDTDADTDAGLDCSIDADAPQACSCAGCSDSGDQKPSARTVCEYGCECNAPAFRPDFYWPFLGCLEGCPVRADRSCCRAAAAAAIEPSVDARAYTEACVARRDAACPDLACDPTLVDGEIATTFTDDWVRRFLACLEEPTCEEAQACLARTWERCMAD